MKDRPGVSVQFEHLHIILYKTFFIGLGLCYGVFTPTETYAKTDYYTVDLGLMITFGSGYSGHRPKPVRIFIGSVHILSVSVSGNVNEPLV